MEREYGKTAEKSEKNNEGLIKNTIYGAYAGAILGIKGYLKI
jgi:hypothetical protein